MKPKVAPIAVRLAHLLPDIDKFAQEHGKSRHAAILMLVESGLGMNTRGKGKAKKPRAKAVLAQAEAQAAHLAPRNGDASHLDTSMVPFNPTRAPMPKAAAAKTRWKL